MQSLFPSRLVSEKTLISCYKMYEINFCWVLWKQDLPCLPMCETLFTISAKNWMGEKSLVQPFELFPLGNLMCEDDFSVSNLVPFQLVTFLTVVLNFAFCRAFWAIHRIGLASCTDVIVVWEPLTCVNKMRYSNLHYFLSRTFLNLLGWQVE